ncbi:MAG: hypothetical protein CMN28_10520 [Salinisphaeraceae bacterium]|jgi:cobalt-zinc-cadmium efflux system outer membrane protein|nr:hypothetical protein [Salinisphaeraceae bacterium]
MTRHKRIQASPAALAAGLFCLAAVATAHPEPAGLTLTQAERQALARGNVARLLAGRQARARGELTTASTWPNPELSLSQESTDLAETTSRERFLWVYQDFDLSGERGLRQQSARAGLAASEFRVAAARREISRQVRTRFAQVLHRQAQGMAISAKRERLAELVAIARKQERAGQAAAYDVLRLERAAAEMDIRAAEIGAEREHARARLAALLDHDPAKSLPALSGTLAPSAPPPLETLLDDLPGLPRLQALQTQARANRLTAKAEGRAAIPDVTLGLGRKEQQEFGRSFDGNLISLGLSIPLFDRNQGERASARAAADISEAEYRLALAEHRGEVRGRWLQLRELRQSAERFSQHHAESSRRLLRAAESGYRGAEVGVLELVDAYTSALDTELRLLDLQKQARDAHIELQALTQGGNP